MYLNLDLKNKNLLAVVDDTGQKATYGELVLRISELKKHLKGERNLIFILSENSFDSLLGYLTFYDKKDVSLLISSQTNYQTIVSLMENYNPNFLWVPKNWKYYELFSIIASYNNYFLLKTDYACPKMYSDLAILLTTSGSTGSPKLVRHKYGNLEYNARNISNVMGWDYSENSICDLPMNYTMTLNLINSTLHSGGTVLLCKSSLIEKKFWNFVKENNATNFTGVPYSYNILYRLKFKSLNIPTLKTFCQGGGRLDDFTFKDLADYCKINSLNFYATYGTTETSARLSLLEPTQSLYKIGSIGRALPGGEMFLVDEKKNIVKGNKGRGELVYKGPNVTLGYADSREDLSREDDFNGVYYTGDLAYRDEDGYYFIEGRVSRFIKLFGHRVDLDHCEKIINEAFDTQIACIGNDNFLLVVHEIELDSLSILNLLVNHTNLPKSCFKTVRLNVIPRLSNFKVNYNELKKIFLEGKDE